MDAPDRLSVTRVMVGLQSIGLIGLQEAFAVLEREGGVAEEEAAAALLPLIAPHNYLPERIRPELERTLRREYLRHLGLDFSAWHPLVEVVCRGFTDPHMERMLRTVTEALARHELAPRVSMQPPLGGGPPLEILVDGEMIATDASTPEEVRATIKARISRW